VSVKDTRDRKRGAEVRRDGRESRGRVTAKRRVRPQIFPYLLLLPALLFELLVHIFPMLVGVGVSFLELTQFYVRNWSAAPFVGLRNYLDGLDPSSPIGGALGQSFLITVAYTVLVVGGSWVLGISAALLVNTEFRARRWFRTLFLIPYALPVYVAVIAWSFMLQQNTGAMNTLLVDNLHLLDERPFWLIGNNAFWSLVLTSLWRSWPFAFLMLLAGLQTIPTELYEAASIDGASRWRRFRTITLPLLRPINLVLLLVLFLWTFNEFNAPYVLFGQAPPTAADLLSLHIYVNSFVDWNFGLGASMSVLLLLFLLVVSVIYIRVLRVGGRENA
jgi:multiple sugar transport system permease protein